MSKYENRDCISNNCLFISASYLTVKTAYVLIPTWNLFSPVTIKKRRITVWFQPIVTSQFGQYFKISAVLVGGLFTSNFVRLVTVALIFFLPK